MTDNFSIKFLNNFFNQLFRILWMKESKFRHESDMKYPSLEPVDLENSEVNTTLPATRPSSIRGMNNEEYKYPALSGPPYTPTGLDLFTGVDHLFVDQKVEFLEAVTGLKFRNKYSVKNNLGEKVLLATEETNLCGKVIFGKSRAFIMRIYDGSMNEVLILKRAATCCLCCIPLTLQKLEVYSPSEILLGSVEQEWNLFLPNFRINNETGDCVLRISGPFFASPLLCGDRDYEIYSKDKKSRIGKISKHWGGIIKEFYTDADNFGISFPMDLDIRMKAVLLGACFLIKSVKAFLAKFEKKGNFDIKQNLKQFYTELLKNCITAENSKNEISRFHVLRTMNQSFSNKQLVNLSIWITIQNMNYCN